MQRFFLPQGHGCAIFLGSLNGTLGALGQLGYGVAKAGLLGLVRILAARYQVCLNAVLPCVTLTNSPNWQKRMRDNPRRAEQEGNATPLGRIARPADVADAVASLVNQPFLNGVALPVDGGLTASGMMLPELPPEERRCRSGLAGARPVSLRGGRVPQVALGAAVKPLYG